MATKIYQPVKMKNLLPKNDWWWSHGIILRNAVRKLGKAFLGKRESIFQNVSHYKKKQKKRHFET